MPVTPFDPSLGSGSGGAPLILHVRDKKATTVDGGASLVGNNIRDLTDVATNTIPDASVDTGTGRVTLPIGTYDVLGFCPGHKVNRFKTFLFNVTAAANVPGLTNASEWASSTIAVTITGHFMGRFELTVESVLEVHMDCGSAFATGLGLAADDGTDEFYTDVRFEKVA